jgi:hypothetical protein
LFTPKERVGGMYCLGKWVGQLDRQTNHDSSNVTCNIRNGGSRSTAEEKTRIKKDRKGEIGKIIDLSSRNILEATNS